MKVSPCRRPTCRSPVCPQPDCEALKRTVEALPPAAARRIQFDKWCRRPLGEFPAGGGAESDQGRKTT